jgi:hypothetical protein
MIKLTSHTYIEAVAEAIYAKLSLYLGVMTRLLANIRDRFNSILT